MSAVGLGKSLPKLPDDPIIQSRIYVKPESERNIFVEAAIGAEYNYNGGFGTSATTVPARSTAGAVAIDHRKLDAHQDQLEQRRLFTLAQAQSGMLEIGSPAFNQRYAIGMVTTRGTIGNDFVKDMPITLLVREGKELVAIGGIQRGSKQSDGLVDSLLIETGKGRTREIPYEKIEVAFAADPFEHLARQARKNGFKKEVDLTQEGLLDTLNGQTVTVVGRARYIGAPERSPIKSYEGTLEPTGKPGQFSISGVEGFFNLSQIDPGQLLTK